MKRLLIALVLLLTVTTLCISTHLYLHGRTDALLGTLDDIETAYRLGDTAVALSTAQDFADEYARTGDWISCYVAHGELREGRETAALLPTLLDSSDAEDVYVEIARLRAHLQYLRQVDDPILRNIL